jgi:hypothetical protein
VTITGLLAWFDETQETLDRCVRSLAGVCDRLIALDGRWELFPGEAFISAEDQREAILEAARVAGIAGMLVAPGAPFESQVAKRAMLMSLAGDADWLLVIDADEFIARSEPEQLREALDDTTADVCRVLLRNIGKGTGGIPWPVRRLYRASTGVTVVTAHNGYQTRDGRWLHGQAAPDRPLEFAPSLEQLLEIHHDVDARSSERVAADDVYRKTRNRERVEAWA